MAENLDVIYPGTKLLFIYVLVKLKKQVICSQNTVGGLAKNKPSHSHKKKMEGT